MKETIVFATGNEGKMREVRMILADLGMEILSMKAVSYTHLTLPTICSV